MIESKGFVFEVDEWEEREHDQSNDFLNNFQFDKWQRSSVLNNTDMVCRYLKQCSKNAIPQLNRTMPVNPSWLVHGISEKFMWPFHATVMKAFDVISKKVRETAAMWLSSSVVLQSHTKNCGAAQESMLYSKSDDENVGTIQAIVQRRLQQRNRCRQR